MVSMLLSFFDFLYEIPTWVFAFILILFCVGPAVTGLVWSRDFIYKFFHVSQDSNDAVNLFSGAIGVVYGLLLGMVAVANWNDFNETQTIITKEAAAIIGFHKIVTGFGTKAASKLQEDALKYTHMILELEWPLHAHGLISDECAPILSELHQDLLSFNPASLRQQAIFSDALLSFNKMAEYRSMRFDAVKDVGVPSVFWIVILLGGSLSTILMYFVHLPSVRMHIVMVAIYSTFIGFMLFLIAALDNPFKGGISVSAVPYQTVIDSIGPDLR